MPAYPSLIRSSPRGYSKRMETGDKHRVLLDGEIQHHVELLKYRGQAAANLFFIDHGIGQLCATEPKFGS